MRFVKYKYFRIQGLQKKIISYRKLFLYLGTNVVTNFSQRQNAVGSECVISYGEIIAFGELRIFAGFISQHNYDVYINGNTNQ